MTPIGQVDRFRRAAYFGGFYPAFAFAMVTAIGAIYFGLWYPVVFAGLSVVIGGLFLRDSAAAEEAPEPILAAH